MINRDKLIVVAFPLGRIGSSAMMGLLRLSGVNVGYPSRLAKPGPANPKGFFELPSQQAFLRRVYPDIYPGMTQPPTLALLRDVGPRRYQEYAVLLRREFESFPAAIKSQRFLTLPFLYELRHEFDVRVLVMSRDLDGQITSHLRIWKTAHNPVKRAATESSIASWIQAWTEFSQRVQKAYDLPCHQVSFEDLVERPTQIIPGLAAFLDIPCPAPERILAWIDPCLVNRPPPPDPRSLRQRIVDRVKAARLSRSRAR